MTVQRIAELRKQTLDQLAGYRRSCAALRCGEPGCREIRGWVRVITRVRRILREEDPLKEKLMTQLFGLDHAVPQRKTARKRLLALSMDLSCSEATLYKWRAEIVELVLYAAIEAGLLQPFQFVRGGRAGKKGV